MPLEILENWTTGTTRRGLCSKLFRNNGGVFQIFAVQEVHFEIHVVEPIIRRNR